MNKVGKKLNKLFDNLSLFCFKIELNYENENQLSKMAYTSVVEGCVGGWMDGKAVLLIVYSNKKLVDHQYCFKKQLKPKCILILFHPVLKKGQKSEKFN